MTIFINFLRSKSILMDFKLCSNCADVFYALDNEKDPEQWHVFNIEDVQTPQSIRWHLIRNIWISQTAEINIGKYEESQGCEMRDCEKLRISQTNLFF